jgi:hypothetical protein
MIDHVGFSVSDCPRIGLWWRFSFWSRCSLTWMKERGLFSMSLPFGSYSLALAIRSQRGVRPRLRKEQATIHHLSLLPHFSSPSGRDIQTGFRAPNPRKHFLF